jgi:multiple sugar transport system ATP-binding protein
MGRAIVREPRVFLMDEPLSNLDAKLRVQVRAEIQKIQRTLGVTTIYVTHDQTEAMTMGDRIAVMRGGTLQQVDTPERVYQWPANQFVAGFIGSPAMNMIRARVTSAVGRLCLRFGEHNLAVDDARTELRAYDGRDIVLGIRPEDIKDAALIDDAPPERTLDTVCSLREALGSEVLIHFAATTAATNELVEPLGDTNAMFVARLSPQTTAREGDRLRLVVDTRRLHFFDPESGDAI